MIWMTCILFLVVVLYYIFNKHASPFVSLAWKSASSACFVLVSFCAYMQSNNIAYGGFMLAGLVLGAAGDVLLALPFCYPRYEDHFFLGGLSAFLFGHLAYVMALYAMPWNIGVITAIGSLMLAVVVIALLQKQHIDFKRMRAPSTLYAAVILFMEACALWHLQDGWLYGGVLNIAALCFVLSDVILAFMLFGDKNTSAMTRCNLSLYYTAQLLLALSMLLR
ncbi:lysoplasmalogenase [[Clostridium] innocuum]|nr:lysoplasmalogenase [[Clostridium] innocuum]